jgi:NADH dehydrogenase [ubiquinone] 1 alpha subcomplex assembly factor 7
LQDHPNAYDGAIIEESLQSLEYIRFIATHMMRYKGAALIIDYGYNIDPKLRARNQYNPTLQAVKSHKYHPMLESLGEADISAHVDFYALAKSALEHGIKDAKYQTQAEFLTEYGIKLRAELLKQKASREEKIVIDKQLGRLILPAQMGELFKVLTFMG